MKTLITIIFITGLLSSCIKEEIQFTTLVAPELDHNSSVTLPEDGSLLINLTTIDLSVGSDVAQWEVDNKLEMAERVTYQINQMPLHGKVIDCDWDDKQPHCTYIPNANYYGPDSFSYIAVDGPLSSEQGIITLDIVSMPDPPITKNGSYTLQAGESLRISFVGFDIDGPQDDIFFKRTNEPSKGTISDCQQSGNDFSCLFSTQIGDESQQELRFVVADNAMMSSPSTEGVVTVTITKGDNYPPTGTTQIVNGVEDTSLNLTVNRGTDLDLGDILTYRLLSSPASAESFNCSGTTELFCTYLPKANFNGEDSFYYEISDGKVSSAPVKVILEIAPVNDLPVLGAIQDVSTMHNIAKDFMINRAIDVDDIDLKYVLVSAPQHGSLNGCATVSGSSSVDCTYTPALDYIGDDYFSYKVFDGSGYSSTMRIDIEVVERAKIWKYRYETKYVTGEDVATIVEIIFVVDNSPSMEEDVATLARGIPALIDELHGKNVNIRIYTTDNDADILYPVAGTTNIQRYNPPNNIIAFQMRDDMDQQDLDLISTAVVSEILGVGIDGSYKEQGLCTLLRIMDSNNGLHVPKDSIGGMVIIADANDATSAAYCPELRVDNREIGYPDNEDLGSYEGMFLAKANNFFQDYFVEVIAGEENSSCNTESDGTRYQNIIDGVTLADGTILSPPSGHFTSICESSYSNAFSNVANYIEHVRTRLFTVDLDPAHHDEGLYAVRVRRGAAITTTTNSVLEFATFLEGQSTTGELYNPLNDTTLVIPRLNIDYIINSDGNILFTKDFLADDDEVVIIYRYWEYYTY